MITGLVSWVINFHIGRKLWNSIQTVTIKAGNQIVLNFSKKRGIFNLIFSFPIVLVCSDYIFKAKIEISIFSLGKGRILAASACPSQTERRAREGKDPSLLISTLILVNWLTKDLICLSKPKVLCKSNVCKQIPQSMSPF